MSVHIVVPFLPVMGGVDQQLSLQPKNACGCMLLQMPIAGSTLWCVCVRVCVCVCVYVIAHASVFVSAFCYCARGKTKTKSKKDAKL